MDKRLFIKKWKISVEKCQKKLSVCLYVGGKRAIFHKTVHSIQPHHLQTLWRFGSGLDSDNLSSNRDQSDQEIEVAGHWEEQSKDDSKQPSPFHARVKLQRLSFQPHKVTDAVPFLHQNCVFFGTKSTQTQFSEQWTLEQAEPA